MVYSFLGMGKPLSLLNSNLKFRINNYRKEHDGDAPLMIPGGIYASDTSAAAVFAAENSMKLYVNVEDLLSKSDIIFLFLSDKALSRISSTLATFPVKGKIFCHFNQTYQAKVLDFSTHNTYACVNIPYCEKQSDSFSVFNRIIVEGYGKQLDNIGFAMNEIGIKCSFINDDEMLMYRMALGLENDVKKLLERQSLRMIKYALASDREICDDILKLASSSPEVLNYESPGEERIKELIKEQLRILKNVGMGKLCDVYESILTMTYTE